jgi:hypothetical protein
MAVALALALAADMEDIVDVELDLGYSFLTSKQVWALIDVIEDGQPFTVVFEKKDGSLRKMLCSIDRTKKEGDHAASVCVVWDREARRIKSFREDRVVLVSVP